LLKGIMILLRRIAGFPIKIGMLQNDHTSTSSVGFIQQNGVTLRSLWVNSTVDDSSTLAG
jgi:hypothetical protein